MKPCGYESHVVHVVNVVHVVHAVHVINVVHVVRQINPVICITITYHIQCFKMAVVCFCWDGWRRMLQFG